MFVHRININGFDVELVFIFDIEFSSAFGIAELNPVCGTIACSVEFVFLDESFQKERLV